MISLVRCAPAGVAVSLFVLLVSPVSAVDLGISPGSLNKNQQDTRQYYELLKEERDEASKPADEPVIEQEAVPIIPETAGSVRTILITRFDVSPSEVLSPEDIASVTDKYVNRKLNISQLMAVVNEINKLYATRAQVIARAVLPRQKVSDGVVRIKLIEAKLGKIHVEGSEYTRDSYIKERVPLASGELIRLDELTDSLVTYNRWNGMTLKASMVPGEEYGTTDIILLADEGKQFILNVFADNAGRDSVGTNRLGVTAQIASVFGYRDRLYMGGTVSKGSINAFGSYDIPVHKSGTRLGLNYDLGKIKIIQGPLEPLNVTGDSSNLGFSLTQPIIARNDYDWDANLAYIRKSSISYFDGVRLVNTAADDIILGTNLRFFEQRGTWLTSHAVTYGDSDSVKGRNYFIYTGSLIRLQYFQNRSSLIFRSRWQLADTNDLPSFNQIIIGGTASVRGYTEGLLIGDRGYTLSLEYAYPISFAGNRAQRSNVFAFIDNGAAFPFRGDDEPDTRPVDFITSVGLGLDFDLFESVSFKVSVGVPTRNKSFYDQDNYRINAIVNWNAW